MEQNRAPVRRPESIICRPIRTDPAWRAPRQGGDNIGLWCPQIIGEEQDILSVWRESWIRATLDEQLRFTAAERGDGVNATAIALRTKNDSSAVGREIWRCLIVPAPCHLRRLPAGRLPNPDVHLAATGLRRIGKQIAVTGDRRRFRQPIPGDAGRGAWRDCFSLTQPDEKDAGACQGRQNDRNSQDSPIEPFRGRRRQYGRSLAGVARKFQI